MEEIKFKIGDRVKVVSAESWEIENYKYEIGYEGVVTEDDTNCPFVVFDITEANYTSKGTSVSQYQLEAI